jgi:hypothetical protein
MTLETRNPRSVARAQRQLVHVGAANTADNSETTQLIQALDPEAFVDAFYQDAGLAQFYLNELCNFYAFNDELAERFYAQMCVYVRQMRNSMKQRQALLDAERKRNDAWWAEHGAAYESGAAT